MNCNYIKQDCEVEIFYKNVTLSGTSSIFVDLREYSSYASAISLNITCSSLIPDQISSVFSSIRPTSGSSIFRGLEPSVFSFELTPSVSFIKVLLHNLANEIVIALAIIFLKLLPRFMANLMTNNRKF